MSHQQEEEQQERPTRAAPNVENEVRARSDSCVDSHPATRGAILPSLVGGRRSRLSMAEDQQQAQAKGAIPDYERTRRARGEDVVSNHVMTLLPATRYTRTFRTLLGRTRVHSSVTAKAKPNRIYLISERDARIQLKEWLKRRLQQLRQRLRGLNGITPSANLETLFEQSTPLGEEERNLPSRIERHYGSAIGDGKVGHGG